MNKKFIAIKKCKKTLNPFSFIIKNKNLQSSYDEKNKLSSFIILLLINQLGKDEAISLLKNNEEQFINLFAKLECSEEVNNASKVFNDNSFITIEEIEKQKIIFDSFTQEFVKLISSLNIKLNIEEMNEFILSGLIYILYSLIDCKVDRDLEDILKDPEYDKKVHIITNNTILFAKVRDLILSNCKNKVSDLVSLINGLTNPLSKDRI